MQWKILIIIGVVDFIVGSRGLYNRQKSIQKMMKNNAQIQKEQ